ncbi:hypothetical protein CC1G_03658 [Coprinopsis cinerea okayama7|uniref:DNA-binding protein RAP1 n=1 Tax=Coprinopsis cinerea (strain Okayama-7 / 130 / ATCC MYA-4618 / FGSC 9003) TaxID=240176 RepID=A8N1W5_COPC7|nr:hypothetical protein CC1G_03658 [Coprinopsis cinerea okayama7\|eukprot:XP_001828864.2 hypothetical protein CC1G_03658 [Coprinopsis cinerea okayama7\
MPIKFFIQKDLPQDVQAELCESITSLGGRVETKVPRAGYILVNPGSQEENRLRQCWTAKDRPERYFVPYTYVEACKVAGTLLKQIFIEDGVPLQMHIHPSIANPNARSALSLRIMVHSGGIASASLQAAKVILADPNTEVFQHLVKTYESDPNKYVESYLWVKKCIEKGAVMYTPLVYKNPGGRRPGEERTQFTEDDEQRLCRWIAEKIPFKETGGRTGNRLYQQLIEQASDPEYAWVTRHTWQSWRERYKKNASRLDRVIARIVEEKQPTLGEKGQYGFVRQPEEKPKRTRKKRKIDQVDDSFPTSVDDVLSHLPHGMQLPGGQHVDVLQLPHHPFPNLNPTAGPYPHMLPIPSGSALPDRPDQMRKTPTREEVEENEEPEWAVRIGHAPPPTWAPRPGDDMNKRRKTGEGEEAGPSTGIPGPQEVEEPSALSASALVALASLHVIDHTLREIAAEFRFTVEEVKEYYDRCGEMTQTRQRFQQMRRLLQERFGN